MFAFPGNLSPTERAKAWETKRVFFLTPQVLTNDLTCGSCSATSIKCLVVDEAHKARGNHSYCQVIQSKTKIWKGEMTIKIGQKGEKGVTPTYTCLQIAMERRESIEKKTKNRSFQPALWLSLAVESVGPLGAVSHRFNFMYIDVRTALLV